MKTSITILMVLLCLCSYGQTKKINNNDYEKKLLEIGENDQKYRSNQVIDWDKQSMLDSLNRLELDKLYNEYGFPKLEEIGKDGMTSVIMVLHHSADCSWNKKWSKIFLNNYSELKGHENLLKFMFKRTFSKEMGHCNQDQSFINSLKEDYEEWIINELELSSL